MQLDLQNTNHSQMVEGTTNLCFKKVVGKP